ncbi:MAG: phage/plasmid primase, P4 family [Actinomycetota bacterium]|nr:phage/plasmid primase, P4 family [Actinomycetota bacterium]
MKAPELAPSPGGFPAELCALPQWLCWKTAKRKGKITKVPVSPYGGAGKPNVPSTWGTLAEALAHAERGGLAGVGFVFSEDDPYCGVDLDKCRDPETGELSEDAAEIVAALGSYSEASPSGTGVHVIVRGHVPAGGNRKGAVEMYDRGRFFTMTGETLDGATAEIGDRQGELEALHRWLFPPRPAKGPGAAPAARNGRPAADSRELSDDELLERARGAKNGERFARLFAGDRSGYDSDSEADLALCSMLDFWTEDEHQLDRLFRRSGLYREKWERADYRERTIRKAKDRTERWGGLAGVVGLPVVAPEANGHAANGSGPVPPALPQGTLFTDVGNARRYFDAHGPDLRYCWPWGKWFVYDGKRWAVDQAGEVQRRAKDVAVGIFQEAADAARAGQADLSERLAKHAIRTQSATSIENMIKLARPDVPVKPDRLDRDPWRLNVENGTLDLKTGELQEHRREHLITKLAPVAYDPSAKAPVWEATLERVVPDPEVRAYFKRLVGYALTGDVSEHVLPVLYGTGANGKSTVLNTLLDVLGDYGMQAPPDLLIAKRDAHPTELADLHGQRFVASIEVEDGRRFAESLVKQLTGGDRIKARRMREDFWEFDSTHKIIMAVNHKPVIRGTDLGIWRRIHLVPFNETIPPEEQDKRLPEKLRAELAGVLAWAVEGCLEWQREGLKPPAAVRAATDEYRREMDTLAVFISERCVEGPNLSVQAKPLYEAYTGWCEENGERYETSKQFYQQLTERGYEKQKDGSGRVRYYGLTLRHEDDDPGGLLTPTPEPPEDDAPPLGDEDAPPPSGRTSGGKLASPTRTEEAPTPRKGTVEAPEEPGPALPPDGPPEALRGDPGRPGGPSGARSPAPGEPTTEAPAEAARSEGANGAREKPHEAEDVGVRAREELRKPWAARQLALIHGGRDNLVNPTANTVACRLFGSPHKWREMLPFVEQAVAEEDKA